MNCHHLLIIPNLVSFFQFFGARKPRLLAPNNDSETSNLNKMIAKIQFTKKYSFCVSTSTATLKQPRDIGIEKKFLDFRISVNTSFAANMAWT